jgi:Fe-S oxidoreductase
MRVSLFATCVVDLFVPEVGESAIRLLDRLWLSGGVAPWPDLLRPAGLERRPPI